MEVSMVKRIFLRILLLGVAVSAATQTFSMRYLRRLGAKARGAALRVQASLPWRNLEVSTTRHKSSASPIVNRLNNQTQSGLKDFDLGSKRYQRNRSWNAHADYGSRLSGTMALTQLFWFWKKDDNQDTELSLKNIDRLKNNGSTLLQYVLDNIITSNEELAQKIIYFMEKNPELVPQVCDQLIDSFEGIKFPEIVSCALRLNKDPKFVANIIKKALNNRKTQSSATALCVGLVIEAYPVTAKNLDQLIKQEFNALHGYVIAAILRQNIQLARSIMPWILRTNVATFNRLLGYEFTAKTSDIMLKELILKSTLQSVGWMSPENLSLAYIFMNGSDARQLKKLSETRFNRTSDEPLPAQAIFAMHSRSYLFEDLSMPVFLYKNFDASKRYTVDELFSATMRDIAALKTGMMEKIYAVFAQDKNRADLLREQSMKAVMQKDSKQADQFMSWIRGVLSYDDCKKFKSNKPYFVCAEQLWTTQSIKKLALENAQSLCQENLEYAFYTLAQTEQEKLAIKDIALQRFGKIVSIKMTPDLMVCLARKKFSGYKFPGFQIEEFLSGKKFSSQEVVEAVISQTRGISIDNLNYVYYTLAKTDEEKNRVKAAAAKIFGGVEKIAISAESLTSNKVFSKPAFLYEPQYAGTAPTQTEQHFFANLVRIFQMLQRHKTVDNPRAKEMLVDAHKKELEELQKGNHVFYHGSQWQWDFIRRIDRFGYNLKAKPGEQLDENFMRFRFDGSETDGLCMNYALFGNANDDTSGTASYVLRNHDYSTPERMKAFATERLLERHGLGHLYQSYKNEFDELEKLHRQSNPDNVGSLIVLSVPDKDIEHVFPAPAGYMGRRVKPIIINGRSTSNIKAILHALKTNPSSIQHGESDLIEFAMRLNKDYSLNPRSSLRMYSYGAVDKSVWAEYMRREKALYAKIERDLAPQKR